MTKQRIALLATVGLRVITVVGDYWLKRASTQTLPFRSEWFAAGIALHGTTAFGWVLVMRHLKFSTLGAVDSVSTVVLLTVVGLVLLKESLCWQEGGWDRYGTRVDRTACKVRITAGSNHSRNETLIHQASGELVSVKRVRKRVRNRLLTFVTCLGNLWGWEGQSELRKVV